jgi:hypothetical protein
VSDSAVTWGGSRAVVTVCVRAAPKAASRAVTMAASMAAVRAASTAAPMEGCLAEQKELIQADAWAATTEVPRDAWWVARRAAWLGEPSAVATEAAMASCLAEWTGQILVGTMEVPRAVSKAASTAAMWGTRGSTWADWRAER